MSDPSDHPTRSPDASKASPVVPPLRSDIEVARRDVAGQSETILKDPLSNRYFRLRETEWFVAQLFDGRRTLEEVRTRALEQFPDLKLPADEIRRFAQRLALAGMLHLSGRQDLSRLLAERDTGLFRRLLSASGRLFFFRIPLVNPDRFIEWLTPRVDPLFSTQVIAVLALIIAAALALLVGQGHRLLEPRAEFLSPQGILFLLLALVFIKVLHELGHAVACKRLGGRVTEMGVCFIVFTPCLYCDVSDAWMFPSRRHRLAVTAAGIAVELVLAAVAAIGFFLTRPGWIHQAAFSIMVAASLSTLLFNGNPLLRYDGYYLLSDAVEMPNLRLRARRYVAALARCVLFGTPVADIDRPDRHRVLILVYAVASYLYGWFILYLILGVVHRKLEPYGLQALAAMMITVSILVQVGVPLYRLLASLSRAARTPGHLRRFARPAAITAGLLVLVAVPLSVHFNETLTQACIVEPSQPIDVRAPHGGFVTRVHVAAGQRVEPGRPLVVLANPEFDLQCRQTDADRRENEILLARARAADNQPEVRRLQLRSRQLDEACRAARTRVDELTMAAPREGIVLSEYPRDLIGRWVDKGDLLLRLARPGEVKVALEMSERTAQRVAIGSVADLRVASAPKKIFQGRVVHNARTASTRTPPVLTTQYGGDVPVQRTPAGWQAAHKLYRAEMQVSDPNLVLRPGMSGRARIQLGRRSVGAWLWHTLCDQLSLNLLLKWQ